MVTRAPNRIDFFEIVQKEDLQISPSLRGIFTKNLQFLFFCVHSFFKSYLL